MRVLLLGEPDSKRTAFWKQAAKAEQLDVACISWDMYESGMLEGAVVKIDPPDLHTSELHEMNEKLLIYRQKLQLISKENCRFLNRPEAILQLLDKSLCKKTLLDTQISSTPICFESVETVEDLLEQMQETHISSVFIKPNYSSGAAGVTAFRFSPRNRKMVAYTSSILQNGAVYNTKKIRRIDKKEEIYALLKELFSLGVIIERWVPKQRFHGKSFDLRIVFQFGKMAFLVARQSDGPITNLHLNNQALDISKLNLSNEALNDLKLLCQNAVEQFDGIQIAGIDVLFEQGSQKPSIIEMNGQGDLIYQDIYHENSIYRDQIRQIKTWIESSDFAWIPEKGDRIWNNG